MIKPIILASVVLASLLAMGTQGWAVEGDKPLPPSTAVPRTDTSLQTGNDPQIIEINPDSPGRVFEGIGGVSASSSILLADYPEPYRSDILDFLFRPKFGAGFQHLKVELGSGVNSTCIAEPSPAVTPEELTNPVPRGWELWLAAEARKRNPQVILDVLPWGTPYFTGAYLDQVAADWVVAFLDVAKQHYGLDFQYVGGCQNELDNFKDFASLIAPSREFVVDRLRPTLDRRGYKDVQIVWADVYNRTGKPWRFVDEVLAYPELAKAIGAIGYHYPVGWMKHLKDDRPLPPGFLESGMRLWSSEDYSCSGGRFDLGVHYLRNVLREYNELRITTSLVWAPFWSVPSGMGWQDTGFLTAREPWNGRYEVFPALWCVAHLTQFVEPGWKFLDRAVGRFAPKSFKGAYAGFKAPNGKDWSFVAVTDDKTVPLALRIAPTLNQQTVHVWKSDAQSQFVEVAALPVKDGCVRIDLAPQSVYSLTTTTGQAKGVPAHAIPAEAKPDAWKDDFSAYAEHSRPRFWCDLEGTFEIVKHGGDNVLQQVLPKPGNSWHVKSSGQCSSVFGGMAPASRFVFRLRTRIQDGYVEVGARAEKSALYCRLEKTGQWSVRTGKTVVAEGKLDAAIADQWHALEFSYDGTTATGGARIHFSVDGRTIFDSPVGKDRGQTYMPYIGSSYHPNAFKDIEITPTLPL